MRLNRRSIFRGVLRSERDKERLTSRFVSLFKPLGHFSQPLRKSIQGLVFGHTRQSQRLAQLTILAKPHLGLVKGLVLIAHQTKHSQQLRLVELVFAEPAAAHAYALRF